MKLAIMWLAVAICASAQAVSFGVRGGLPFTNLFGAVSNPGETFESSSTQFVVGPTVELHLPLGLGVEVDALYRHFHDNAAVTVSNVATAFSSSSAWEFPLLLKYRLPGPFVRPFLDAGVAFDYVSGSRELANFLTGASSNTSATNEGFVAGAGIELRLPVIRLSPEIRYTRWGSVNIPDLNGFLHANPNQVEFLVGVTF